jgi:hypothetical protein
MREHGGSWLGPRGGRDGELPGLGKDTELGRANSERDCEQTKIARLLDPIFLSFSFFS